MKDLIPYAIVAVVCLLSGLFAGKQCSDERLRIETDTLTVQGPPDTVVVTSKPRTQYVVNIDTVKYFVNPDGLQQCTDDLRRCEEERWYLSEIEAEATENTEDGEAFIQFSMPRFLGERESAFAYRFTARQREPKQDGPTFWQRFGYGPVVGIGITTRGADAFVGVGGFFDLSK
jgi:hypothetical protein